MGNVALPRLPDKAAWLASRSLPPPHGRPMCPTDSFAEPALATVPPEAPELPAALQTRPALHAEMKQRVLRNHGAGTTAVVGVKQAGATMATQGMGGVGKTTAAAALLRDPEVRAAFQRLLWVTESAESACSYYVFK